MYATQNGHKESIQLLIDQGAKINHTCQKGKHALIYATNYYRDPHKVVALLLAKGADINLCDTDGKSALMYATQNGYEKSIQLLINKRAMINHKQTSWLNKVLLWMYTIRNKIKKLL